MSITVVSGGQSQRDSKVLSRRSNGLCNSKVLLIGSEPVHDISNNMICATSKASDQPAHTRSLIRAFASRLGIL